MSASVGASSGKAPVTAPVAVQGTIQAQLVSANFERRGGLGQCGRKSGGGGSGAAASGPSDWPRRGHELFDIFVSVFLQFFREIAMSTFGMGPSRGILAKTGFWE